MRPIAQRLAHVRDRVEPGHWEGDLVIGKKMTAAIGTLVERTSRYLILAHLPHGYEAPQLRDAVIEQYSLISPPMRKTLTWDQGREMARHEQTEVAIGTTIYFCDPHSPWQRPRPEPTRRHQPPHRSLGWGEAPLGIGHSAGERRRRQRG